MDPPYLHFVFAFSAGFFVTLSPCGIALIPAYVGYLLGESRPRIPDVVKVVTVAALSLISTMMGIGLSLSLLGNALAGFVSISGILSAVIVISMGALMMLSRTFTLPTSALFRFSRSVRGLAGSALFGVSYAVAASSCTAPILVAILSHAASLSPYDSLVTMTLYGIGASSPILAVGFASMGAQQLFYKRAVSLAKRGGFIGGALLVIFGLIFLVERLSFVI
ncbi:MAG: hypothetical protein NZ920_04840 [Aigarchaeota archaeon]|nr:hypothetical protein [Aigarchaeota archaeon]MDW8093265.1 cytochrome c biogenesis protein CcdA [Nitrososphaerota archaeon]